MPHWPSQIKRLRRIKGLKQSTLAQLLEVDQASVSRWESGTQSPNTTIQHRLTLLIRDCHPDPLARLVHQVRSAPVAKALWDQNLTLRAVSHAMVMLLGVTSAEDVIGKRLTDFLDERGKAEIATLADIGFFAGDVVSVQQTMRLSHSLGRGQSVIAQLYPVEGVAGEFYGISDVALLSGSMGAMRGNRHIMWAKELELS